MPVRVYLKYIGVTRLAGFKKVFYGGVNGDTAIFPVQYLASIFSGTLMVNKTNDLKTISTSYKPMSGFSVTAVEVPTCDNDCITLLHAVCLKGENFG